MSDPAEKTIPIPLAIMLMLALMLLGSGLIWRFIYLPAHEANKHVTRITLPPPGNPHVAGGPDVADPRLRTAILKDAADADLPDGVHERSADEVLVKAGDGYMRARKSGDETSYSFGTFTPPSIEWEHGYLSQGVRRMVQQDDFAKEIGVTEQQRKALAALPEAPLAKWPQADRDRFAQLYQTWATAQADSKPKAAGELVAALKSYVEKKRSADQERMENRVKQIRETLTAEQVKRINPEGR